MVLRRCLAGALVVSGTLAAGSCTLSSDLPRQSPTSNPVRAVGALFPGRPFPGGEWFPKVWMLS